MRCQVINLVSHTNAINLYDISHTFPCRGQGGSDVASMPSPVNHDLLFRRASKPHGVIVPTVEWHQVQASQSRAPYTTESYTHNERQACMGFEHVTLGPRGASQAFFDGSIVPAGWVQARDAHHYSCPSVMPLDGPWGHRRRSPLPHIFQPSSARPRPLSAAALHTHVQFSELHSDGLIDATSKRVEKACAGALGSLNINVTDCLGWRQMASPRPPRTTGRITG
jgi:hypothetical protein